MGLLITATLPNAMTGDPADSVVNTFAFSSAPADHTTALLSTLVNRVRRLYIARISEPDGNYLAQFLSPVISREPDACILNVYDITNKLDGRPHGSPIHFETMSLAGAASTEALPHELAIAVTVEASGRATQPVERPDGFDSNTDVDRPRQRYTGRNFIGPLNQTVYDNQVYPTRPLYAVRNSIATLFRRFGEEVNDLTPFNWCVWSRADEALRTVSHVSIDNAFDIQRRRGEKPTERDRVELNIPHATIGPELQVGGGEF